MQPSSTSRRDFVQALLACLGALAVFRGRALASKSEGGEGHAAGERRWGMVIDLDRCTACQACVVACSVENNMTPGGPEEASQGRLIRWLKIMPRTEVEGARIRQSLVPMPCQHCEDPPCVRVCPTSATFMNPEGIVGQVYDRCIGCRYCVNACPYTCKFFNWGEPEWPKGVEQSHNPDVSMRYKGVVEKCLFCHHRLQRAKDLAREENREVRPQDYVPACMAACPAQAIAFGDLNDPESEVSRLASDRRAYKLLDDLGTKPKVIYLREG